MQLSTMGLLKFHVSKRGPWSFTYLITFQGHYQEGIFFLSTKYTMIMVEILLFATLSHGNKDFVKKKDNDKKMFINEEYFLYIFYTKAYYLGEKTLP